MIESLNAIRSLGLAPVFEDLYFGRANRADLLYCIKYPGEFHNVSGLSQSPAKATSYSCNKGRTRKSETCCRKTQATFLRMRIVALPIASSKTKRSKSPIWWFSSKAGNRESEENQVGHLPGLKVYEL
jgi:hypothetical protein